MTEQFSNLIINIADAIARMEGYFTPKLTRGQRNNNPGNLMHADQRGAVGRDDKGFAIFQDNEAGWQALYRQIRLDMSRGLSLNEFLSKYAPPHENATDEYIRFVAGRAHISRIDRPLRDVEPAYILSGKQRETRPIHLVKLADKNPQAPRPREDRIEA